MYLQYLGGVDVVLLYITQIRTDNVLLKTILVYLNCEMVNVNERAAIVGWCRSRHSPTLVELGAKQSNSRYHHTRSNGGR